jgi:hypothetical protein
MSGKLLQYNQNLLKSVLLLTLAVSGNFVGNTLGCKSQYHMTNNMYVKHVLLLFIIYFTLNFSSDNSQNPTELFKNAFIIWICYLLFTKQNITFTAISIGLIIATYILDSYVSYYDGIFVNPSIEQEEKLKSLEIKDKYVMYRDYTFNASIFTILLGFGLYFKEKYLEYAEEFDILTFLFGKVECYSLR